MSELVGETLDVAARVAEALQSVGARYFLGGSLASSLDGNPRATNDIDFVIDMAVGRIPDFVRALGPDFEVDDDMLRDAVLHGRSANIFYLPLVLKIDFFGHAHSAYDESEFDRSRPIAIGGGRTLIVKAPEDTVLRKLLWFRDGGEVSDRQWHDILGVLRTQEDNLDQGYLRTWAARLGISNLLDKAMAQAAGSIE